MFSHSRCSMHLLLVTYLIIAPPAALAARVQNRNEQESFAGPEYSISQGQIAKSETSELQLGDSSTDEQSSNDSELLFQYVPNEDSNADPDLLFHWVDDEEPPTENKPEDNSCSSGFLPLQCVVVPGPKGFEWQAQLKAMGCQGNFIAVRLSHRRADPAFVGLRVSDTHDLSDADRVVPAGLRISISHHGSVVNPEEIMSILTVEHRSLNLNLGLTAGMMHPSPGLGLGDTATFVNTERLTVRHQGGAFSWETSTRPSMLRKMAHSATALFRHGSIQYQPSQKSTGSLPSLPSSYLKHCQDESLNDVDKIDDAYVEPYHSDDDSPDGSDSEPSKEDSVDVAEAIKKADALMDYFDHLKEQYPVYGAQMEKYYAENPEKFVEDIWRTSHRMPSQDESAPASVPDESLESSHAIGSILHDLVYPTDSGILVHHSSNRVDDPQDVPPSPPKHESSYSLPWMIGSS